MPGYAASVSGGAVLLVAVLVAAACLIPLLSYLGYRQRKAVMAYAKLQGWTYRDHDVPLADRYDGAPFTGGDGAQAEAVICGDFWGMPFAAYAYTYQTDSSDEQGRASIVTHSVPVVALMLASGLPDVDVVPAASATGERALPGPDICVGDTDFDAAFTVRSAEEGFVTQLLHRRLTHDLMAYPAHSWSIRGGDVLSIGSWNGKPEKIPAYLDHLGLVVHSIPSELWDTYGRPRR
jgi:hypothetical protein